MIYRIDVRTAPSARDAEPVDPVGQAIRHQIEEFGTQVGAISTARVFLIDTDADRAEVARAAHELLADPVVESADLVIAPPKDSGKSRIEIHLKPGVMDPVAASTEMALRDMGLNVKEVRTGRAYHIAAKLAQDQLHQIASKVLANSVIESIHFQPFLPDSFPIPRAHSFKL